MHLLITIFTCVIVASKAALISKCDPNSTDQTSCGVRPTRCTDSYYRTYDGSCNNIEHGWWGTPYVPYKRLLQNNYYDGVHEFAKSVTKKKLPNVREISLRIYAIIPKYDKLWTLVFMQYAQLVAHDLSLTAGVNQTNTIIACCDKGQLTEAARTDPNCAPISIPKNDPFNTPEGRKCMHFYRTDTTKGYRKCKCATAIAEPLTAVTAFLDISYMYGDDEKTAKQVREFKGGRLRSVIRNNKELLPQDPDPVAACNVETAAEPCYFSGDVRVNQNPELSLLQNLYLMQHNTMARELAKVNPQWDDEKLFQVTRHILIAQHQHVIYYELLPPLIGKQHMIDNQLIYPDATGFIRDYDPDVNPTTANEFSTAAFRLYHTEIVGSLEAYTELRTLSNKTKLSDWFIKPEVCEYGDNFNGFTRGLAYQAQSQVDRYFDNVVLNLLFSDGLLGLDLKAIDIQRSRDHGMAPYAQALRDFGLSNPKSFEDFEKFIDKEYVKVLSDIYESFEDVDLAVGCSLERNLPNALCGATVQYILTDQFKRTRKGDRYFYENRQHESAFTIEQLNEIRSTSTIARFLCSNQEVKLMQRRAFEAVSLLNPLVLCKDIPKVNLNLWKEKQ